MANELLIDGTCRWFSWFTRSNTPLYFNREGSILVESWSHVSAFQDGPLSGVIADWMKENYETLLLDNNREDVDDVIEGLMLRFHNPDYNSSS